MGGWTGVLSMEGDSVRNLGAEGIGAEDSMATIIFAGCA